MSDQIKLLQSLHSGDPTALARCISIVENDLDHAGDLLLELNIDVHKPVVGITGPPGGGKSTLIDSLVKELSKANKRSAILAIDPTSPFNFGTILGDRIRMQDHFTDEKVFIRSIASRGSLGGLSEKTMQIVDVIRASTFDYIFIETVGVGQSEVEIAGLADTTVLVLVPEAGDEVQIMKSGILEIADILVVNKADRPGTATFVKNLSALIKPGKTDKWKPPIIETIGTNGKGVEELLKQIDNHHSHGIDIEKRVSLLASKALAMIKQNLIKDLNETALQDSLKKAIKKDGFNLYRFLKSANLL